MFRYDRFNALVKETGVSKSHLCRLLGRGTYYFRDAEKTGTNISGEVLNTIAEALGTTPEYLTGESDEKKPAPEGELINDDPELTALVQDLKDRPEMRMLFSLTRSATKEDVERAVKILEALRGE